MYVNVYSLPNISLQNDIRTNNYFSRERVTKSDNLCLIDNNKTALSFIK